MLKVHVNGPLPKRGREQTGVPGENPRQPVWIIIALHNALSWDTAVFSLPINTCHNMDQSTMFRASVNEHYLLSTISRGLFNQRVLSRKQ